MVFLQSVFLKSRPSPFKPKEKTTTELRRARFPEGGPTSCNAHSFYFRNEHVGTQKDARLKKTLKRAAWGDRPDDDGNPYFSLCPTDCRD